MSFKQWLSDNSMNPSFQLNSLESQAGIKWKIVGYHNSFSSKLTVVKLSANGSEHPIAKEVDGKFYILPAWTETEFEEEQVSESKPKKQSKIKEVEQENLTDKENDIGV